MRSRSTPACRFGIAIFLVALTSSVFVVPRVSSSDAVRVEGGLIAGTTAEGVRSYKGIPFAAAPTGDLRWKPPQPVVAWQGVRECIAYGPDCPQAPYPAGSMYYSPPRKQSEDCLYLNVWTTAKPGDKRPVMVWIHGGGWQVGDSQCRSD